MSKKKINFNLSSKDYNKLCYLIKDIQQLKGIDIKYSNKTNNNDRGIDISSILSIFATSMAIPALLKMIELFLETKKTTLEVIFPEKNIKINISSFSKEKLKDDIKQLENIFMKDLK